MTAYYEVAIVTLLSGIVLFGMGMAVARAHAKTGILAPTMTGDPLLERAIRGHVNTLEGMPIFLPALWLFAIYWNPRWAAVLGVIWIVGRIVYFIGYLRGSEKRFWGFFIQSCAAIALTIGALGRIAYLMVSSGTY